MGLSDCLLSLELSDLDPLIMRALALKMCSLNTHQDTMKSG